MPVLAADRSAPLLYRPARYMCVNNRKLAVCSKRLEICSSGLIWRGMLAPLTGYLKLTRRSKYRRTREVRDDGSPAEIHCEMNKGAEGTY